MTFSYRRAVAWIADCVGKDPEIVAKDVLRHRHRSGVKKP